MVHDDNNEVPSPREVLVGSHFFGVGVHDLFVSWADDLRFAGVWRKLVHNRAEGLSLFSFIREAMMAARVPQKQRDSRLLERKEAIVKVLSGIDAIASFYEREGEIVGSWTRGSKQERLIFRDNASDVTESRIVSNLEAYRNVISQKLIRAQREFDQRLHTRKARAPSYESNIFLRSLSNLFLDHFGRPHSEDVATICDLVFPRPEPRGGDLVRQIRRRAKNRNIRGPKS